MEPALLGEGAAESKRAALQLYLGETASRAWCRLDAQMRAAVQTTSPRFGQRQVGAPSPAARRGAAPSYAASVALEAATQWNRPREPTMKSITFGPTPDEWTPPTTRTAVAAPTDPAGLLDLLFSAEGRMRRRDYWVIGSLALIVFLALAIGLAVSLPPMQALIAVLPVAFVYIRIRSCVKIKRWHDRGKSATWGLISLVPMIGSLWAFVELGFLEGTSGPNLYGPPAK
jgi:uncharacterized membrane protein YhaH (DUF805 family)